MALRQQHQRLRKTARTIPQRAGNETKDDTRPAWCHTTASKPSSHPASSHFPTAIQLSQLRAVQS